MKELQFINKYFFKYRTKLLLGLLITIIARVFSLFAPRLIGNSLTAVEKFLQNPDGNLEQIQNVLLINILIIIGTTLASGFLTFWMRQTIINVSRYIEFDLKNEIFWHYQKLTQRFYKNNRTGDLMNRISEDVGKVRMYVGPAFMYSVNTISLFVIVISYMISIAPELTLYTILPLPILSFTIYKLSRIINIKSTLVQEMLSKMSSFSQEGFSGIAVIKSYNLESKINANFNDLATESYEKNMSLVRVQAWFFPLMILLIGCSNLIVIYVGGNQYINGEIEIGVLAEFIIYVNMLTWPVAVVGWITSIVQQAEASQKRINAFLKEQPEIEDGIGLQGKIEGNLKFKNVTLRYPETNIQALNNISIDIPKGTTVGVIGNIGSGKTTFLDLISRLYDPSKGTIELDGNDLKKYRLEELRSAIGYVPQNAFLFSESIEDNIRFGAIEAKEEDIIKATKKAAVHQNITEFKEGYKTLLGERGVTLSGGQIQRVSIARVFIKDPKILLLDDCLSAVDTDTEEEILKHLKSVSKDKTTIIVSHRISSIKHADKIIVFENGQIVQQGKHIDLVGVEGYYQELYEKQQSDNSK
ncbi:ABC transporter ATP-binding protein/permease [Flavobacteriaceae bacterium]|nr:ABC transporter ATP-binding protein [Flavobacteriaceae bacterium]MBT4313451.1 ABC transporter ATP-binding protein [Flavobacteriaceae bacterium]MBT5090904.1 ABC transporter ATP-binding protein [Flavobacteriaceae bacterium]MBT5447027.1 ABC transporter ATP-binding protein [Flavobacteriaceae bacterium]MBT5693494.1 ABC transporter ATP-binding protein [Flavobacteriaceae bacterium]